MAVSQANCSIATQWALADAGEIEADADVVGAGVLIAFIVSAHTTFIVTIIGYLTFSFEDKCRNRADDKIVESIRKFLRKIGRIVQRIYRACKRIFRRSKVEEDILNQKSTSDRPEAEDDPARKYRIEALRSFMLALSDQQLVTGVAMLVAAFGRWSEITVYSANVVSALAYFSTSVHMGTLDFLITYLRRHGIVKGCRVAAMVATMILLEFILVMQLSSTWWQESRESDLFLICAFWNYSLVETEPATLLTRGYVIVIVLYAHYERVTVLYSRWGRLPQGEDLFTKKRLTKYGIKNFDYRISLYKQRARKLLMEKPSMRRNCMTWALIESFAFHETHDSRVWDVASLLYANIYGAILIFFYRNQHEGTVGPFNTMGFGQIVPVFLLALLIFAAIESIYGYQDALEEVNLQSTVTQPMESIASSRKSTESGSMAANTASVEEVNSQEAEHTEIDITEPSQRMVLEEPVLNDTLDEVVEDASSVYVTADPSITQSEGLEEFASHQESFDGLHGKEVLLDQIRNREEYFTPQNPNRTFSTGIDLPSHPDEVLLRPIRNVPIKTQTHKFQEYSLEKNRRTSSLTAISRSSTGQETYESPIRSDTEARLGISISHAEALLNAVQENPKALLARFICEDPFEIPEVRAFILAYAFFIIVVQTILAVSTHLMFTAFLAAAFVYAFLEARHWLELIHRLRRIDALGRKMARSQK